MNLKKLVVNLVNKYPNNSYVSGRGIYGIFMAAKKIANITKEGFDMFFNEEELKKLSYYGSSSYCFKVNGETFWGSSPINDLTDLRQKGFSF